MAKRSSLRASDADRDRVADRLKEAATDGRIHAHELEERLAAALRARTYGELDAVVADLPGARMARPTAAARTRRLITHQPVLAVGLIVAASLVVLLVAAVVIAGLFAFAGVWILVGVLTSIHRGGSTGGRLPGSRHGRFPGSRYGRGPQGRMGERGVGGRGIGGRGAGGAWRY